MSVQISKIIILNSFNNNNLDRRCKRTEIVSLIGRVMQGCRGRADRIIDGKLMGCWPL